MKPGTEGEDRSRGRDSNPKAAEESILLEPCPRGNLWKDSDDLLAERRYDGPLTIVSADGS